jgi:putative membrane protein
VDQNRKLPLILLALNLPWWIWSFLGPLDRFTWYLEIAPAAIGIAILILTYRRFPLTDMTYVLIYLHSLIFLVGGHYTYARVPLFNWIRDAFELSRNHFDRLGHFMQGFVPAIIGRELFLRKGVFARKGWLPFFTISVCLAISAFYELTEWWTAVGTGEAANDFLGSQGDVWDSQWDMFMAGVGATCAFIFLSRLHDRFLEKMKP